MRCSPEQNRARQRPHSSRGRTKTAIVFNPIHPSGASPCDQQFLKLPDLFSALSLKAEFLHSQPILRDSAQKLNCRTWPASRTGTTGFMKTAGLVTR